MIGTQTLLDQTAAASASKSSARACDLCGSNDATLLHRGGRDSAELENIVCQRCGFVFVAQAPEAEAAVEQYTQGTFSVDARGDATDVPPKKIFTQERAAMQRYRHLRSRLPAALRSGGRILEVGCGLGSFLSLAKGAGAEVVGVEPDPLYAVRGSEIYRLPIEATPFERFEGNPDGYDAIVSFHVLEHLNSPREFGRWAADRLKPGGRLVIEVPSLDRPYGRGLTEFFWSYHLQTFSERTLRAWAELAGLRVVDSGFVLSGFVYVVAERPAAGEDAPPPPSLPYEDPAAVRDRAEAADARLLGARGAAPPPPFARRLRRGLSRRVRAVARRAQGALGAPAAGDRHAGGKAKAVGPTVAHFGFHVAANAGDIALLDAVRAAVSGGRPVDWKNHNVHADVTADLVERLNQEVRGVLVGGGGLFLKDTNPNDISGWQWPCPPRLIERFEIPLAIYAVGYNRFRGQDDFSGPFGESVRTVVEKAAFVGLRNEGSRRAIANYVGPELAGRVVYQPCPTTVFNKLMPPPPGFADAPIGHDRPGGPVLAINTAFDRHWLRLGERRNDILGGIARTAKLAADRGWRVVLANHCNPDAQILPWLHGAGVEPDEAALAGVSTEELLAFYRGVDLCVGMRGHAQMVPFGVGTPIVSIVSHDKMGWFLEDLGHPEWGADVQHEDFADRLDAAVRSAEEDLPGRRAELDRCQDRLWAVVEQNARTVRGLFGIDA